MDKEKRIDYELKMISKYQGLKFSRYYVYIALLLYVVYSIVERNSYTGIYIMLYYTIIPIAVNAILSNNGKEKQEKFILNVFRQKTHYTNLKLQVYTISNYLLYFLLMIWLYMNIRHGEYIFIISIFPFLLSVSTILIANIAKLYYLKLNHYRLKYNLL